MPAIAPTSSIEADAALAEDIRIGEFCSIGHRPERLDRAKSEAVADPLLPLKIGANALIRSHTVIYAGTTIGDDFQTGHHVLIREGCRFGRSVSVGSSSVIEHHVILRDSVRIHSGCFIPEFSIVEEDAWIGPGVIFMNAHFPKGIETKERLSGPIVGRKAKIGAGAMVLPGVRIGEGALVGAGAVVTRDVPPKAVVAGNPARIRSRVSELRYKDDGVQPYPSTQDETLEEET